MKFLGVIPARYASTRLPGKPLVDICGKPMLWWVYQKVKKIKEFFDVICAIDDERTEMICKQYNMRYIMTSSNHPDHIARMHEVSERIEADYYICVNGDEPLISAACILPIFPSKAMVKPYFGGAMRILTIPAEVIDPANIKLVLTESGRCLYMSRTPIPYPKGSLSVQYKKYVGVECFNKAALNFFVNTPMGHIERCEDIDHLRFLENGVDMCFTKVESTSISVDTPKDLEFVRKAIRNQIMKG